MNVQLHNTIKHYRKILVEDLRNQPESVRNHYVKRFDVASKMAVYDLKKLGLYESWKIAPASNNLFLTEIKGINDKLVNKLPKEISYPLQSQIDAVEELVGFYNELGKGKQGKENQKKLEAFAKDFGIDSGLTFKEEVKALRNELVGLFKEIENEGIFSKIKRAGERFVARVTGAGSVQKPRLNVDEVVGALAAKKAAALAAQQAGIITAAKPAAVAAATVAKPAAAAAVAGKAALGLGSALAGGAAAAVGAAGMGLIYGLVKSRDLNKRKDKIERLQDIANAFILQNKLKIPKVDEPVTTATEPSRPIDSSPETGGADATGGAGTTDAGGAGTTDAGGAGAAVEGASITNEQLNEILQKAQNDIDDIEGPKGFIKFIDSLASTVGMTNNKTYEEMSKRTRLSNFNDKSPEEYANVFPEDGGLRAKAKEIFEMFKAKASGGGGGGAAVVKNVTAQIAEKEEPGDSDTAKAREILGLSDSATEEQIVAKIKELRKKIREESTEELKKREAEKTKADKNLTKATTVLGLNPFDSNLQEQIKREVRKAMLQELKKLKKVSRR